VLHAVASLSLTSFTCTCGLSFSSLADLTAHITASNGSGGSTSPDPSTGGSGAAAPPAAGRVLGVCSSSGCGHPQIAHFRGGPCRMLIGAYGLGGNCPCRRYGA
jgi:hypothetical protein